MSYCTQISHIYKGCGAPVDGTKKLTGTHAPSFSIRKPKHVFGQSLVEQVFIAYDRRNFGKHSAYLSSTNAPLNSLLSSAATSVIVARRTYVRFPRRIPRIIGIIHGSTVTVIVFSQTSMSLHRRSTKIQHCKTLTIRSWLKIQTLEEYRPPQDGSCIELIYPRTYTLLFPSSSCAEDIDCPRRFNSCISCSFCRDLYSISPSIS